MTDTESATTVPRGLTSRWRALALAATVAVAAAACVPPAPTPPTVGAELTASVDLSAVDPGDTVTITGTGYTATGNLGTRPPFFGQPAGVYVVFARLGDPWKPSEGASGAARQIISQVWALPAAQHNVLDPDGSNPEIVLMAPDGSFETDLTLNEAAGTGEYAVATYAGSGAVNAGEEIALPVTFNE